MWKLLRNLLLCAAVLALGLKLALWLAARQQAQWLADTVQPWGTLSWTSAGGGFDGEVRLSGVQFRPKPGLEVAAFDASELRLEPPGLLWLLQRAITRDASVPPVLGIALDDANLPGLRKLAAGEPAWFGAQSLVPFETLACGASQRMAAADYTSMQVQPRLPKLRLRYTYDGGQNTLGLEAVVDNAPFVAFRLHSELREFSPQLLDSPAAREQLRIGSADLEYRDYDFLRRRNQFCARQTGVDVEGYLERHIAGLQEILKVSHVVPAEGILELYRGLLRNGGSFKLLSLPREDIAPAQYHTYDPEEVLRWLNLTARHNDAPPVLFKLFFLAEPVEALAGIDRALVHDPLAEPDIVVVRPEENPVLATTIAAQPPPPNVSASAPASTPAASSAPAVPVTPVTPAESLLPRVPERPRLATPAPRPDPQSAPPLASTPVPRIETAPSPTPAVRPPPRLDPRLDPRLSGLPSAPPPAPGSTAALVWQGPRIDRLPEKTEREKPFVVVSYAALDGRAGTRVVLITSGGKEIEGKLAEVSATGVTVSVTRESGQARLFVERNRILEIRVVRRG